MRAARAPHDPSDVRRGRRRRRCRPASRGPTRPRGARPSPGTASTPSAQRCRDQHTPGTSRSRAESCRRPARARLLGGPCPGRSARPTTGAPQRGVSRRPHAAPAVRAPPGCTHVAGRARRDIVRRGRARAGARAAHVRSLEGNGHNTPLCQIGQRERHGHVNRWRRRAPERARPHVGRCLHGHGAREGRCGAGGWGTTQANAGDAGAAGTDGTERDDVRVMGLVALGEAGGRTLRVGRGRRAPRGLGVLPAAVRRWGARVRSVREAGGRRLLAAA